MFIITCISIQYSQFRVMHLAFFFSFLGGSFRQFLWQVVRELQSTVLPILMPCPSGASGLNHGKYILAPGPMSYSEEKLLHFFGQVTSNIVMTKFTFLRWVDL